MPSSRYSLVAVGVAAWLIASPAALRVLRVNPSADAAPNSAVEITFDRPVAGSLDRTVDPAGIVRVQPGIDGTIQWRDPVTIVLTPRAPLQADTRYTVTVSTAFAAMDGSRLEKPYVFSFRVRGPRLIAGAPANRNRTARFLTATSRFTLVYSAPVDLEQLSARALLRLGPECGGTRLIHLRAASQRPLDRADPYDFRSYVAGTDSLRRVVQLLPATPLPLACSGEIVAPTELARDHDALTAWRFSTYGPLTFTKAECATTKNCPTGPLIVQFDTPVRGSEVRRALRILPATPFSIRDTTAESDRWILEATLVPRTTYVVVADTGLRDIFGQRLRGNPARAARTSGYEPSVAYEYGRITVERTGFGTLPVRHVNVDTLVVTTAPVPDSLEGMFLRRSQWNLGDLWTAVRTTATVTKIPVRAQRDRPAITGIRLPRLFTGSGGSRHPALLAVRVGGARPDTTQPDAATVAVVQTTDLGVHAKIGAESGVVWVTGMHDGAARAGVHVSVRDYTGHEVATGTTNLQGIATFARFHVEARAPNDTTLRDYELASGFEGYVVATLGDDRALTGVSEYDPDLSPWRFNVSAAWGASRIPVAGAVFTERGIYRPGEAVYSKAIMRTGSLGVLAVPAPGDSLRWLFTDRDEGTLTDTTVALSPFGTAEHVTHIPDGAPLGLYAVRIQARRDGRWYDVARTTYRVAEYRPPEFLVDMSADTLPRFPGDSLHALVQARYLFGGPMARASVTWRATEEPVSADELGIPDIDGYFVGESGWWWENGADDGPRVFAGASDTLDARGERALAVPLPEPRNGRAARVTISAAVQDVNRQVVGATAAAIVHPAAFYIAAKPLGRDFFWREGVAQTLAVVAVQPGGERVAGVAVAGTIARREWHQVHRERDGVAETVGEWVTDTVGQCAIRTGVDPVHCTVTPPAGGMYIVTFRAGDAHGRAAVTTFYRWASGKGWVPWDDESRFKVDVIPDRTRYAVGDTATVMFASPFTGAEAWITVEREGLIQQRRMTLTSGSTTLRFPITEAFAPNAFVSIFIVRGRSAPPGRLDDPGRPTIRVGYAELRVTPEVKRLAVQVQPLAAEYRPGDTARVRLLVREPHGAGQRAEVTLWSVDEGVLALTGYQLPDPLDLLYQPRGLGLRLASNMANVAPQIPEGEKGGRSPGGGGGAAQSDILRSRFKSTAFFLGTVLTGDDGTAEAAAKLPDNLTRFRVMAVAVTAGDRYGSGESSLLVSRPLVARPALPRFVRPGDEFTAGTVVNRRAAGRAAVTVQGAATGIELRGRDTRTVAVESGRGTEVRFPFHAVPGDSATFTFGASSNGDADAVRLAIPVRAEYHPTTITVSGTLRDSGLVEMTLPAGLDPERSRVTFSLGASPLAVLRGVYRQFHVYPYFCTEQVASVVAPLIALARADSNATSVDAALRRAELRRAVAMLSARQRPDGGIGFWSAGDWTSPWLSAWAGRVLLGARSAGIAVDDSVLARLGAYLGRAVREPSSGPPASPVANWYESRATRLGDRVAAVDYLSRAGFPDIAAENSLYATAAQMHWEDRVLLGEVMARRGAKREATMLVAPAWHAVHVEGNRAVLPPQAHDAFYFRSTMRPLARLLSATLTLDPSSPLIGPMVQTLTLQGREASWLWSTQDAGSVALALGAYEAVQRTMQARGIRVSARGRTLFATGATGDTGDSTWSLSGLLSRGADGGSVLRLSLAAGAPAGAAPNASDPSAGRDALAFFYITLSEVPRERPVRPADQGIQVERWYENPATGTPVVSVEEGALVRVRLRVKASEERHFVVLDDPLPAGLEAVDLGLLTAATVAGPGATFQDTTTSEADSATDARHWWYGSWDGGWWSPWDHKEIRDDRVVFVATMLWPGTYTATYLARATTPGAFVRPPAYAEEMYNPAVSGQSDGGVFTVRER